MVLDHIFGENNNYVSSNEIQADLRLPRMHWLQRFYSPIVFSSMSLVAQNATGNISGTVADASGAVIPKATVTLTDEATNTRRETVSNTAGIFNFAAVLPATYTVTVSADGFRSWEQRGIAMTQGNNLNVPSIKLEVGTSKQEVQVVGNEVVVPTEPARSPIR